MCRAVACAKCGKMTWKGCGQHVDAVMAPFPRADRCPGHAGEPSKGWLAKLFGR